MSKSTEDSFWEGFVIGAGLPGSGSLYELLGGDAPPDRYHWEVDEDLWGHYPVLHLESQEDQAYWAGYLAGLGVGTAGVAAFLVYASAELGLVGSVGFGLGQIGLLAAPLAVPVAALTLLAVSVTVTHEAYGSEAGAYWSSMGDVGSGGAMPTVWETPTRSGWKEWWDKTF